MNLEEWQKGSYSKIDSLQRMNLHNEWLKQQHKEVIEKIIEKKQSKEEVIIEGFPKD